MLQPTELRAILVKIPAIPQRQPGSVTWVLGMSGLGSSLTSMSECYYLGWDDSQHNYEPGITLSKALAKKLGIPLTVIRADKNHLPASLKGVTVATPRSGGPMEGRLVAALHPNLRIMTRFFSPDLRFLVIDGPRNPMRVWAEMNGALDFRTREALIDERPEAVVGIHEAIGHNGYNGFTSEPATYTLDRDLKKLFALGWLDERGKDYLVASQLIAHTDETLADLRKAADKVNPAPPRARAW